MADEGKEEEIRELRELLEEQRVLRVMSDVRCIAAERETIKAKQVIRDLEEKCAALDIKFRSQHAGRNFRPEPLLMEKME